ncbi:hypothetical protein F4680DRAFT_454738 [Xylaria scruposa]|nr:hypothetical protein F4680DRAFT_454738 [Xylaria scruposa]
MASCLAVSEKINAKGKLAVAEVQDYVKTKSVEKIAVKPGFKNGAIAKAHYKPLLLNTLTIRLERDSRYNKAHLKRAKLKTPEMEDANKDDTRNYFISCYRIADLIYFLKCSFSYRNVTL